MRRVSGPRGRPRVWPLALAVLPAGFGVAELTDVRALGGVVLVAGGLAVVHRARRAPLRHRVAWGGVTFGLFVVSHVLGELIGSWPAVACVAALSALTAGRLLDGHRSARFGPLVDA